MIPPNRRNCGALYETTHHVFLEFTGMRALQKELLSTLPSIQNCLYSSIELLIKTSKFARLALALKE